MRIKVFTSKLYLKSGRGVKGPVKTRIICRKLADRGQTRVAAVGAAGYLMLETPCLGVPLLWARTLPLSLDSPLPNFPYPPGLYFTNTTTTGALYFVSYLL